MDFFEMLQVRLNLLKPTGNGVTQIASNKAIIMDRIRGSSPLKVMEKYRQQNMGDYGTVSERRIIRNLSQEHVEPVRHRFLDNLRENAARIQHNPSFLSSLTKF
jgi:hypothetical protein